MRDWIRRDSIGAHQPELLELVRSHPRAAEKRLNEAERIRKDKYYPNGLVAVLTDGSVESFSWLEAVGSGRRENHADHVRTAFREAVDDQTRTFRNEHGYRGRSEYHVGHGHNGTGSFAQLRKTFLDRQGLSLQTILVENVLKPPLEHPVWQLQDARLRQEWQQFHREQACLAMEHKDSNLRDKLIKEPSRFFIDRNLC